MKSQKEIKDKEIIKYKKYGKCNELKESPAILRFTIYGALWALPKNLEIPISDCSNNNILSTPETAKYLRKTLQKLKGDLNGN